MLPKHFPHTIAGVLVFSCFLYSPADSFGTSWAARRWTAARIMVEFRSPVVTFTFAPFSCGLPATRFSLTASSFTSRMAHRRN